MNSKVIFKTCCMLIAILLLAMGIFGCMASPSNSPEAGSGGQTSQGSAIYGDKQKSLDELVKNADLIVYGIAGDTIIEQTAGRTLEFTVDRCVKGLDGNSIRTANPNTNTINIMQMYSTSLQLEKGKQYVLALVSADTQDDQTAVEMGIVRNSIIGAGTQGIFLVNDGTVSCADKSFDSELKVKNPTVDELLSQFEGMIAK